jgi:hypothetical protein
MRPTTVPPTMMIVPAEPPTIAPTSTPAPPTIINAPLSRLDPESKARATEVCAVLAGATVAFIHDGVACAVGTRSMTTADGATEDGAGSALAAVVS